MVARSLFVAAMLVGSFLIFGATSATACHKTGDLCLPCPTTSKTCDEVGTADSVSMIVQYVDSAVPYSPTSEESMLASSAGRFGGTTYFVVSFEWDTDDHTAPAGHADVPFRIQLSSDDAAFDPDEVDVVYSATATERESHYFEVDAHTSGDVEVEYSITPHPNDPNAVAYEGTLTIEGHDPDGPFGPLDEFFRDFWGWILLLVLLAIAIGVAIGHWLLRTPRWTPRPVAL